MLEERSIRYIELLGVLVVAVSLFLDFGQIPIFDGPGANLVDGGYYLKNVSLLSFLTASSGAILAGILLGVGLLMIVARAGGQVLAICGTAAIVLMAFSWDRLYPLPLGISVPVLVIGTGLCSARFVSEQAKRLEL